MKGLGKKLRILTVCLLSLCLLTVTAWAAPVEGCPGDCAHQAAIDAVNVGDTVEVYIKKLDAENKKISLGYKKVEDNPWEIMRRDYPVGTVCKAKVVGMTTFGAFANVIPGIDGLIHISQIADRRINKPEDVLTIGEEVDVKVTEIDFDKKRVSLSIRALIEPVAEEAVEEAVAEEAAEEAAE